MGGFDAKMLVFDTETTGTDPEADRVVELGAAYFEGRKLVERRRDLVDPGVSIPEEAAAIHGIRDEMVAGKPRFDSVGPRFVAHLLGEATGGRPPLLCGYNALSFDVPILNHELARAGLAHRIDPTTVVDPIVFVRWHLRGHRVRRLEPICAHFGVALSKAHSAGADAQATGALLFRMIEEGLIPDDPEAALAAQAELLPLLDREWDQWTYWLYRDRRDGFLRLGAGQYCGEPLDDVDPGYLSFLLDKIADLPLEVREEFQRRVVLS